MSLDFSSVNPEEINPTTGLDFSTVGSYSPYVGSFTSAVDPTEYEKYIGEVRPELGVDYLDFRRAQNQGGVEQLGAFLNQAIVGEIIGGSLEGIGYLGKILDAADIASGEEQEFGNAFSQAGKDLRTWSQEATPIHESAPGEFAPGKWSWWMSNGVSVASTLSLLIPSAGTIRGISLVGKALGATGSVGKIGKAMGLAPKLIPMLEAAAPGIGQAFVSRHMESLMESSGKYDEIYKRNLGIGLSIDEAKQNAAVAASDIYNKNWVMLLQDIPQYLLIGRKFGKAGRELTPKLLKAVGKSAGMAQAKTIGKYAFTAISEGGEEAYQYIVSEMADDLSRSKLDPTYESRETAELTNDAEFWTSVAMGAIGGGVFQMAGRAVNKAFGVDDEKQRLNVVRSQGPIMKLYSGVMREAEEAGDVTSYEQARAGLVDALATKSLEVQDIDALVANLEQMMDQEATPEALEKYGIAEEDIQYIKENFPSIIKQVKEVAEIYEYYAQGKDNTTVYDADVASVLASTEAAKRRLNIRKKESEKNLADSISNLDKAGFADMSGSGRAILINEAAINAHKKVNKFLNKRLESDKLTDEIRKFYEKKLEEINNKTIALQQENIQLKANPVYTPEDKKKDSAIEISPDLLTAVSVNNATIEYTDMAISKKNDTMAKAKQTQKDRKAGTIPVPQEPTVETEPEVVPEEPVSTTVHEGVPSAPEGETIVETKEYEPKAEDIKQRRKDALNRGKLFELLTEYGADTLREIFEVFEQGSVLKDRPSNTGILKKEGDNLYFYSDNLKQKLDVTDQLDKPLSETGMVFLSDPIKYKTEDPVGEQQEKQDEELSEDELEATEDLIPDAVHPLSDAEIEATPEVVDTKEFQGEAKVFYGFNNQPELTDYLNNPENDLTNKTGEFFVDYTNKQSPVSKTVASKLQTGSISKLTQKQLDSIPLAIRIEGVPGKVYLPKGDTTNKDAADPKVVMEHNRALRTLVLTGIVKGNKVTVTGIRKDSGVSWNVKKRGSKNNIIKALNLDIKDVRLGVAMSGGSIYDRLDNILPAFGNPNGGNIYLATDRTPNGEIRTVKLNKTKVDETHANIILNAFQQSIKGWKNAYEGAEVTTDIDLGSLLGLLVVNGKKTILTEQRKEIIGDPEYIERLEAVQLYRSGRMLYYGANGKINLNNVTPEDRKNFVEYAINNFNYSIQLAKFGDKLSDRFKTPTQIGSWNITQEDIDNELTFEQHYVKNGWVTTDLEADKYGNVTKMPGVYINTSTLEEETTPATETSTEPTTDKSTQDEVNDLLDEFRPFTSKYYEGNLYVRENVQVQIDQIREILGQDVSVEVLNDFIQVIDETGSHLAFGQVKDASIQLYERAEAGTGYHEAYHIVSLYYLTGRQRTKVYQDAAAYYKIDPKDERAIEEALAEDFRLYMGSDGRVAPKAKSVQNWFQRLLNQILDIFVNPSTRVSDLTIEKLFNNIENGVYKEAKIRNKNLKKYAGYAYLRKVEGFSTEQTQHITDMLMYQMLTKNNVIRLEDIGKLSLDPVINYLKDIRTKVDTARNKPGIKEETKVEFDRLFEVYDKILKNFPQFANHITDKLIAMNIRRQNESFEDSYGIDMFNLYSDTQDGKEITKYDKASYVSSSKDNLRANIKLFIATLPASGETDPYTQMPKMLDFVEAYSKIMMDLHKAVTFEDIIRILEQKSERDLFYKVLLDGDEKSNRIGLRNAPESFRNQFEIAVDQHRHEFNNVVRNPKTGEHIFVDAAVSSAEREMTYNWSLNFYLTGKFIEEDDTINQEAVNKVINFFNNKVKIPVNQDYARGAVLNKYEQHMQQTLKVLNFIGINVTEEDLQNAVDSLGKDEQGNLNQNLGFHKLVNDILFGVFGSKGVLNNLSDPKIAQRDQRPEELIAKDNKIIELAKLVIEGNIYLINDTILGAESNTYYVYSQPSLLTSYVKNLKKGSELARQLRTVKFNKNSLFLKQVEDGAEFGVVTLSSYRNGKSARDYIHISSEEDFLLKFDAMQKDLIPLPTLADRKAYYFYKGLKRISLKDSYVKDGRYYVNDNVIDIFYNYAQDEASRIEKVRKEIAEAKESKDYSVLVQNKHYNEIDAQGTPIFTNDVNGLQYHHFKGFNTYDSKGKFTGTIKPNKNTIRASLRSNVINTLEYAESLGLVKLQKDRQGKVTKVINKQLSASLVETYEKKFGNTTLAIFHILSDYTLNTISSTIETEKMITMDPAYAKGVEDKIKRLTAVPSPGDKLILNFSKGEFKDKTTYRTAIIRSFMYNDRKLKNRLYVDFTKAFKKQYPEATREEIRKAVNVRVDAYSDIDVTDGQAYVTLEAYREIKNRMGEWETAEQEAYDILISDTKDKDKLLKAQELVMQPLKLMHYGPYFNNGAGIPIYDKMSVAVLLPSIVKGTFLEPLYDHMKAEGIEMLKYDTVVKVGNIGMVDYFDNKAKNGSITPENLQYLRTYEQSFQYLRKQQVTDPHIAESRKLGSQVLKLLMANLRLDESIYNIRGSEKDFTGREIGNMFSKAYASLSNSGRESVEKALGIDEDGNIDKAKLYESLRWDAIQSNMPYNIVDALFTDENGKPNIHLDTLLNRRWTESRMISMIAKKTVDLYTPGTDLIQMSGGGLVKKLDGTLQLMDKKGRTEIKVSVSLFKGVIPNYEGKTFKEKVNWLKQNRLAGFEGLGYRIPVQGQNSMIPFIVTEFLPEIYGNTIILPYGFTKLTGSDFDIDKLFVARYNYYHIGDKIFRHTFHDGNEDGKITNEETLRQIYKEYIIPKLNLRDNLMELQQRMDRAVDKKATLLNAWNKELGTDIKVQIAEEVGIVTVSQEVLDKFGMELSYEQFNNLLEELLELPTIEEFIKENKGKDAFEVNHRKAVENRLLDLSSSVLTNGDHILETKTPLDTFTGKLKDMAKEVKDKKPLEMMEAAAPAYQLQVKNWYIGGGKGIGPFALNNVHHALTQFVGYSFSTKNATYDISRTIGDDGVYIIDWLSALINAHVDIAKDPYIFHLNVTKETYDTVNLLIRAGYGEQTFWLLNQEAVKSNFTHDTLLDIAVSQANKVSKTKEEAELRVQEVKDIALNYSNVETTMSDKDLKKYIKQENKDYIYYAKQAGIANAYFAIQEDGRYLSKVVLASRLDNKKGLGTTLGDVRLFGEQVDELINTDEGFARLIEETHLRTLYENSIVFIKKIYSKLLIDATDGFTILSKTLATKFGVPEQDVSNALYSSIVSIYFSQEKGFNISKEQVSKLFKGKTSLGYRIRSLSETHPELANNKLIQTLKPVLDRETGIYFIKSLSGDKNDKDLRDTYSDDWGDLLQHPDEKIRRIAEDLVYYSFYTSGFNRSLYTFYQDMPVEHLNTRPTHADKKLTKSFDEFVGDMLKILNDEAMPNEFINQVMTQTMKTLSVDAVEEYRGPAIPITGKGKVSLYKLRADVAEFLGYNLAGKPIFKQLYKFNDPQRGQFLLEYAGYKSVSKELIYKVMPQTGRIYKGHKLIELGYEGSILEGDFSMISNEVLRDTLNTVEGFEDFVYIAPEDREAFRPAEPSDVDETIDVEAEVVEQTALPESIEEDPFLTDEQIGLLKQIPTGFESVERMDELRNAAINMDTEEFKTIVEQIRSCYGG